MAETDSELITLRGGLTVPLPALQMLWNLEDRGLDVQVDGADIIVRPRGQLTADDRAAIGRLKPHLLQLIAYCEREAWQ